ncbi:unannotated protein [freshwater metagenome]|uniref:Unannotated protein n=1 Tax=freshwater metagenome TaxID=449393 RepID=A0A6J6EXE0_9ZZZZ
MRRVSAASTRPKSRSRGVAKAWLMAALVISWNTTRCTGTPGLMADFRFSTRCQLMASPSRSSSVARYTALACFTSWRNSLTTLAPRSVSSYVGLKWLSTSTANPLEGRSAT